MTGPQLTDTSKATVFTVIVLLLAVAMAASIRLFSITSGSLSTALYMVTPALTALIMMLVVTRDGFSKEGWKTLGLHRLGIKAWWIAIVAPALVGVVATAIVWATPSLRSSCPTTLVSKYSTSLYSSSSSRSRFLWARNSDGEATCSPSSCLWVGRGL